MAIDTIDLKPIARHSTRASDLLAWPLVGRFLKWKHARTVMQIPLLLLSALIVFDGFTGPQLAPKNIATTTAWVHYRGILVFTLLIAGLQIAQRQFQDRRQALRAILPWLVLTMLIGAAGMWLLSQPMEMRGTFMTGS